MSIMSDRWIKSRCVHKDGRPISPQNPLREFPERNDGWLDQHDYPMIEPFHAESVRSKTIDVGTTDERELRILSYGLSSFGYDVRLSREFKIFTNINSVMIDPRNFDDRSYVDHIGDFVVIPPNGFILGLTEEYIRVPRDVLAVCLGKSTLARCGANVMITPLEPEWEGRVVIEVGNCTNLPLKIYAGDGVAQLLFLQGDQYCETSYADRKGKYNKQTTLQVAKV